MTPYLDPVRLAKTAARRALHALEDITSVRPGNTGPVRWIDAEPSGWAPCTGSHAPTRDQDPIRWDERHSIGLAGVCHVERADVFMLKPSGAGRHPLDRRAAVCVHPSRRVKYPGALYLSSRQIRSIFQKTRQLPNRSHHLEGRVALLGNEVSDACNYYHFWLDTVGDLLMLRDTLPSSLQPDRFLVSHAGEPWQEEILDRVGIAPEQVVRYADHERLTADELLVPLRDKGAVGVAPGLVDRIRHKVNIHIDAPVAARSLYISRGDSSRRTVTNEAEVRDLVRGHGIDVAELSRMRVADQIDLFASARLVVATHGAGLTNLMWCQEGATVIELLPDRHRNPCFRDICAQRKLRHDAILCPQLGATMGLNATMTVPLGLLDAMLSYYGSHDPLWG